MITIHSPKQLDATVQLPSSKSISNRALVINTLAGSRNAPRNVSDCDDTRVMLRWLSERSQPHNLIDIGAAGTAMRFSTALLAVTPGEEIITGTERMRNRPIGVLVDALRSLGATVSYVEKEGYPPLRIIGNPALEGGDLTLAGNVSSQYISALLMIAPVLRRGLRLTLTGGIISRPYIDMTLAMMRQYGAVADWTADNVITVEPHPYTPCDYYVESDWSAASYWYQMVALSTHPASTITLPGLFAQSLQGDSLGAQVFAKLGVRTEFKDNSVILTKILPSTARLFQDFVTMPDLAQTFVVTCCMMNIPFHFTGLQSLKIKETDRIEALKCELRKLGYAIQDRNDSELHWNGERYPRTPNAAIDTYEDHRMAMAFAPCALRLPSININHPEVVSKSYPRYWDDLLNVGFDVK